MLPVGDAREDDLLKICEDLLENLAGFRGRFRQLFENVLRPHLRFNRVILDMLQVIRHPVDQFMGVTAKIF